MLEAFGLPVLASAVVDGPDEAVAAFTTAGRPVALKAVADGVLHKATAGGRAARARHCGRPRCVATRSGGPAAAVRHRGNVSVGQPVIAEAPRCGPCIQ